MKPKHYIPVIISIFAIMLSLFLTGCSNNGSVVKIAMADENAVEFRVGEFSYDGIKVVLFYENGNTREVNLNENMISEADKLNFYKIGEHTIKVSYNSKIATTMKISVARFEFDNIYRLEGYTCVYDGKPHVVELNYELPEGTTVEYPYGNSFTNAGEYNVEAIISKPGYVSKKLSTTLVIEKAQLDISSVKYTDRTYTYDGEVKTIEAQDIPSGVKVEYEVWNEDKTVRLNSAINVGTYTMVAKFGNGDENYDQTQTRDAKLTITKAKYNMSSVGMDDAVKTYDGNEFQARLSESSVLPGDVEVEYKYYNSEGKEVTSTVDAGEYKIVASFTGKNANYDEIAPIEAKLTVNKAKVSIDGVVTFNSSTVNFDREMHKLEVTGNLPAGVSVTYENNEKTAAGEYKVIARFSDSNPNEELDITELEAFLIINKIVEAPQVIDADSGEKRSFESKDLRMTMDPATGNKKIDIVGLVPDKYDVKSILFTDKDGKYVNVNNFCDNVSYSYNIVFAFIDEVEKASIELPPVSGDVKYSITFEDDLRLDDVTVTYDGKPHGLSISKELPVGTTVEYPNGEEFTEAGTYQITWVLSKATYAQKTIVGNLKITQADYDMSAIVLEDTTISYDAHPYSPEKPGTSHYNNLFDKLPDGVSVKQITSKIKVGENWQDYSDSSQNSYPDIPGEYTVTLSYNFDAKNYNPIPSVEYKLTITTGTVDLSNVKFEDLTIEKTGGYFLMSIKGTPYMASGIPQFAAEIDPTAYYSYPVPTEEEYKLPEKVYVTYTYKDSNGNVIATVDTTKKFKVVIDSSGKCTKVNMTDIGFDDQGIEVINSDVELVLPKEAGTYTVIASFTSTDNNYAVPENSAITATLTITEPQA